MEEKFTSIVFITALAARSSRILADQHHGSTTTAGLDYIVVDVAAASSL